MAAPIMAWPFFVLMLIHKIEPRSSETNATGHIDHTVIPVWFELARAPIYRLFNPTLSFATWNIAIRKVDIDYVAQVFHDRATEVRTCIAEVKNTSLLVRQELWQGNVMAARGTTVLVHFNYTTQQKQEISQSVKQQLLKDDLKCA